ncbi:MAG: hypothetical protein ABI823_02965 [Bryobacteraceae bacterium]
MKTGYEITFDDFLRLCLDHTSETAPLLRKWFGYEIAPSATGALLHDAGGVVVRPEAVHERIQADPERQNRIYNLAMTLWR